MKSATSLLESTVIRSAPSRPIPSPPPTLNALDIPQLRSPRLVASLRRIVAFTEPPNRVSALADFLKSMETYIFASSALPFPTSSSLNFKLDVDAGNRLNAHAPHPLAPSSKSASFTTTADLARRVVLNTLDDFSNSPAGSFLDATLLRRPTLESVSSTLLSIHSVISTLNASPSSHLPPQTPTISTPHIDRMASRPAPFRSPTIDRLGAEPCSRPSLLVLHKNPNSLHT
ncbi:hypothetical protein R3P38DRAFT_3211226 [Favolaschia claudopus]|uniref:Uncharacterized protein n=1 Tax=Favolaschia claudopus TaxID=2862362 RepID=A0AAW0AHC8_9AGAR